MAAPEPVLSSDEEEDEEGADDTPIPAPTCLRARASVSAEAFGDWNKRTQFNPPVHPKTPEQMAELTSILTTSFLFASLESKDMQHVVLAMQGPICLAPGQRIICEGNSGDHLYVITDGVLDCMKVIDGEEKVVKMCTQGDLFGELALLYNSPRAASVVSREASTVWELDRETFNNIVMEAVQRKRSQCSAVLRKVPLFQTMSNSEVDTIIDALKMEKHAEGAQVITQGDSGNLFYIVYEGKLVATKKADDGQEFAMSHEAGDYFGELALLQDQPRAATVVAATEVCLLSMDRSTFKRLMGPAEDFLKRGAARYE